MNARHKKFILNKLIPFILREQGRGFVMEDWLIKDEPGIPLYADEVERKIPVCGTVCCLGGSIQVLKGHRNKIMPKTAGRHIGLNPQAASGLFMNWDGENGYPSVDGHKYGWPRKFADKYAKATTPYRKAQVAVSLLKEVVKTNGECLRLD